MRPTEGTATVITGLFWRTYLVSLWTVESVALFTIALCFCLPSTCTLIHIREVLERYRLAVLAFL